MNSESLDFAWAVILFQSTEERGSLAPATRKGSSNGDPFFVITIFTGVLQSWLKTAYLSPTNILMMQINKLFCFLLFFILPIISSAQDTNSFISDYSDSSEYRIIIKTQELLDGKYVTLDVFTIKAYKDSTKVYYVRYGDMLISSLIMQYSILERMIAFETNVNSLACQDDAVCTNRILFEGASNSYSVPIDLLNEELISNLMLELEK